MPTILCKVTQIILICKHFSTKFSTFTIPQTPPNRHIDNKQTPVDNLCKKYKI